MRRASAAGCRKMTKSSKSGSSFTSCSLTYNSDVRYLEFEKRPNLSFPSGILVNLAQISHLIFFWSHPNAKFCSCRNKINFLVYVTLGGIFMRCGSRVYRKDEVG